MWQNVSIQLAAGAGSGVMHLTPHDALTVGIITQVYIPAQPGVTSGVTDFIISHLLPDGLLSTIFTLTNPTIPFRRPMQELYYDQAGVTTTNYMPDFVQDVSVTVAQGNGANRVDVWLLIG